MKVKIACMCLFLVLFVYVFCIFWLYQGFASMSMDLMCWFFIADTVAMMVMELESRFSPSAVMDALSIVYFQFWLEPGNEDKLTEYMNTLKQTYAHIKDSLALHIFVIHVQQCWVLWHLMGSCIGLLWLWKIILLMQWGSWTPTFIP